jgi:putative glutamine amidotransferase
MQKKPIIGITLDLTKDSEKYKYATFPWYALRKNYADSVLQAGGIPVMIPYSHESIDTILELIDGLVIPGGDEDVNPKFYNQQIISGKVRTNDERAGFELALTKKALEKDMPFLGICGGMQVLNVSLGGNLIQHIPDYIQSKINHEQPSPKDIPSHPVIIKPGTILFKLADSRDEVMVNSTHHQAVDKLGNGLIISASAPDGIIEAIESLNHKFVIGVEWHPEYLNSNNLDLKLFKGLIDASS